MARPAIARPEDGFTLVETTIIVLILVILAGILLAQLGNYNRLSRKAAAKADLKAICSTMEKFRHESRHRLPYRDPRPRGPRNEPIGLLVGPGRIPDPGSAGDGTCFGCNAPSEGHWRHAPGATFQQRNDRDTRTITFHVGLMQDHWRHNSPGVSTYPNPIEDPYLSNYGRGWRGPYLNELRSDPWGNRYMINTFSLLRTGYSGKKHGKFTSATVCYSAGPNGLIDTIFNQPGNDADGDGNRGWVFGGDDLGVILDRQ